MESLVSLYTKFFYLIKSVNGILQCYFTVLPMQIIIVYRPNKFKLSSLIRIFHNLKDFSREKVNRLPNMEHISTIFMDVLSSNVLIF